MRRSATSNDRSRASASVPSRGVLTLLFASLVMVGLLSACGSAPDGEDAKASQEASWIPGLEGVKSGEIEAALSMRGPGQGDQLYMRVLGSFLGAGGGKVPKVDVAVEATGQINGEKVDFFTALINGAHRAAITYEGDVYEMGPKTYDPIRSSFERALGDGTAADMYACLGAAAEIDVSRIAGGVTERDLRAEANDGSKVVSVATELEPSTLSAVLRELIEDPGCGAQLAAAGPLRKVLEGAAAELEGAMKRGNLETFVDQAGLLRELRAEAVLDPNEKGKTAANFVYSVSHVNEVEELPPCTGEKQIEAFYRKLGFNPLKAMETGGQGLEGLLEGIYARALA
jgi:hypothetical protein